MGRLVRLLFPLVLLCSAAIVAADLTALGAEYRALREVKGHFQGGEWRDEVDHWKGRKHAVMAELGEELGIPGTQESQILEVMGPPDERAEPESSAWRLVEPGDGTHLLIYRWRGMHDFLYFVCDGPSVRRSGWWMALE